MSSIAHRPLSLDRRRRVRPVRCAKVRRSQRALAAQTSAGGFDWETPVSPLISTLLVAGALLVVMLPLGMIVVKLVFSWLSPGQRLVVLGEMFDADGPSSFTLAVLGIGSMYAYSVAQRLWCDPQLTVPRWLASVATRVLRKADRWDTQRRTAQGAAAHEHGLIERGLNLVMRPGTFRWLSRVERSLRPGTR